MRNKRFFKIFLLYQVLSFVFFIWAVRNIDFFFEESNFVYISLYAGFKASEIIFLKSLHSVSDLGKNILLMFFLCEGHLLYLMTFKDRFLFIGYLIAIVILQKFVKICIQLFCQEEIDKKLDTIYRIYVLAGILAAFAVFKIHIIPVIFNLYILISLLVIVSCMMMFAKKIVFIFKGNYTFLIFLSMGLFVVNMAIPIWGWIHYDLFSVGWIVILFNILLTLSGVLFFRNKQVKRDINVLLSIVLLLLVTVIVFLLILKISMMHFLIYGTIFFEMLYIFSIIFQLYEGNTSKAKMLGLGIAQILREEKIYKEFSNFLHDDVLQDLNAVNQLLQLNNQEEAKGIMEKTIQHLNQRIREKMNQYDPKLVTSCSLYENYYLLLNMIKAKYPGQDIFCSLDMSRDTVLIAPYDTIVYRWIREIVNNAFKYSKAKNVEIVLKNQAGQVELILKDDGIFLMGSDWKKGKGLETIENQVESLNGTICFSENVPSGLVIHIAFQMKGEDTIESFVNR